MRFIQFFLAFVLVILSLFMSSDLLAQKKKYYPLFDQELTKKEVKARYKAFAEEQEAQGWTAKKWRQQNREDKKARKAALSSPAVMISVDSMILSPEASDWADVRFKKGVYTDADGDLFTGRLMSYHEDESPRLEATVIQGKLNGFAREYHPNGQLKIQRNYVQGAMTGEVVEYFENGQLKLSGTITGINTHGGDQLQNAVVGYYKNGTYRSRKMKQARIQFTNQEGYTTRRNEATALEEQGGYMLFDRSKITGEQVYTPDSRRIVAPEKE